MIIYQLFRVLSEWVAPAHVSPNRLVTIEAKDEDITKTTSLFQEFRVADV